MAASPCVTRPASRTRCPSVVAASAGPITRSSPFWNCASSMSPWDAPDGVPAQRADDGLDGVRVQPLGDRVLVQRAGALDPGGQHLPGRVGVGGVLARGRAELLLVAGHELVVARVVRLGAVGEVGQDALGAVLADALGERRVGRRVGLVEHVGREAELLERPDELDPVLRDRAADDQIGVGLLDGVRDRVEVRGVRRVGGRVHRLEAERLEVLLEDLLELGGVRDPRPSRRRPSSGARPPVPPRSSSRTAPAASWSSPAARRRAS